VNGTVVVDTDVISFLMKGDPKADWYQPYLKGKRLMVCFVTIAELYFGAFCAKWGPRRLAELQQILRNYIVYPFDEPLCVTWAKVRSEDKQRGIGIGHSDAWIAATALLYQIPLVTNNAKHFVWIDGLQVISATC